MTDAQSNKPDFDSIRQINEAGLEYWSARDLSILLGYTNWQDFEVAVKRAIIACKQIGQNIEDHLIGARKVIVVGNGATQTVKDYLLSRFGAYLIAQQNGDPRKPEIAAAQAYFATAAKENELYQLLDEQAQWLEMRQLMDEGNKDLEQAAHTTGMLPRSFGLFHRAGYESLYVGIGPDEIKKLKDVE